jgi:hypothetical protein
MIRLSIMTSTKARKAMLLKGLTREGKIPTIDETWTMAGKMFITQFRSNPRYVPSDDSGDYMTAAVDNLSWVLEFGCNQYDESEYIQWLTDFCLNYMGYDGPDIKYPEGGCDGDIRFDIIDTDKLDQLCEVWDPKT